ncbi:uncharacterized protein LODBEIA_P45730 [Lodderomyces beijingensis]|uniref:Uncharacterized protein n=1 Tax=Lodderomyces beijingensis TaxID=1775926 RepID=A0ABP0ZQC1_9ASCO
MLKPQIIYSLTTILVHALLQDDPTLPPPSIPPPPSDPSAHLDSLFTHQVIDWDPKNRDHLEKLSLAREASIQPLDKDLVSAGGEVTSDIDIDHIEEEFEDIPVTAQGAAKGDEKKWHIGAGVYLNKEVHDDNKEIETFLIDPDCGQESFSDTDSDSCSDGYGKKRFFLFNVNQSDEVRVGEDEARRNESSDAVMVRSMSVQEAQDGEEVQDDQDVYERKESQEMQEGQEMVSRAVRSVLSDSVVIFSLVMLSVYRFL